MREGPLRLGVLASGRGSNLQAIIDVIEAGRLSATIEVVVSDCAEAPALARARRHGLKGVFVDPKVHPERALFDRELVGVFRAHQVELVCLAGFMRILSKSFVAEFPGRIMNIHPALLPAFPGLHAQRQALEYGVRVAGCTIHFVDEGVDTGPIILQATVPILDDDTEDTLSARILTEEHKLYPQAIQLLAEGRLEIRGRRVLIHERPGQ